MPKQRVVITGLGVVAPNGTGKEAFWQALMQGLSGVRSIRRFDASALESRIGGELVEFDPLRYFEPHELKKIDRSSLYAIAAGLMALEDSGLELAKEDLERVGSAVGNGIGGVDYVEKEIDVLRDKGPRWTSPYLAIAFFPCATNGLLSIRLGLKGVILTLCNGNTSGTDAVGMACQTIRSGRADVMFTGGAEAPLVPTILGALSRDGFLSQQNAMPEKACRPFDRQADGMVLGEGSGMMVLESLAHARARGAPIYGEVAAYASGNSAFDTLKPETNGWGLVSTMRRVLREAQMDAGEVDVVHSQGFSMPEYDAMEARCIGETFDKASRRPLVTAVSSWIGNSLGALGGLQAVACALMLSRQQVPAIANATAASPSPLELVRRPLTACRLNAVMQNSFCFMGKSSTLLFKRFEP